MPSEMDNMRHLEEECSSWGNYGS